MNSRTLALWVGLFVALALPGAGSSAVAEVAAGAVQQESPLEPRIKNIAVQLRCPVCQGETIYDSHSTVASQMKALIKEKVAEGKSDKEIVAFFVDRYGEFVLMEPRKSGSFLVIWLFPVLALVAGIVLAVAVLMRRQSPLQPVPESVVETGELIRRIERLEP